MNSNIINKYSIVKILLTALSLTVALGACASSIPTDALQYKLKHSWGHKGKANGEFNEPTGIAITADEIFISDARNARIQVFDYTGNFKRAFGNTGENSDKLGRPMNLAIQNDELYVADYFNDAIKVYSLSGKYKRRIGNSGDGPGEFNAPVGVDVADNGDLFVADFYNQRIQQLNTNGSFIRQWGTTGKTGIWSGKFNYPTDVAIDKDNNLFVADGFNDRVQVFDNRGEYSHKWGGLFGMNVSGSRPGWFTTVTSIKIGPKNNIYVTDFYNDRVQIFNTTGELIDIINIPSNGVQHSAIAMAVSNDGSLFIINHGKHEIQQWQPNE